jgi:exonuclease SbcC
MVTIKFAYTRRRMKNLNLWNYIKKEHNKRRLGVRSSNLNSLVGVWEIEFTHQAYTSDGIFAITGPTCSGKTTILDAICLGLYGRTPGFDRVTNSSNEIISRQTGLCFAEVTFETQRGHYRCY